MKIGVIQMDIIDDKNKNLDKAEELIRKTVNGEAEIVVLPEMFNTPYQNDKFDEYSENENGTTISRLKKIANDLKIIIVAGSIPEKDNGKIYNTCFIIDETGNIIGKHRKAHLFDVDIKNKIFFKESLVLTAGEKSTVVDTILGKIGIAICYDIRFPELFRKMTLDGAWLIIVPAAFNTVTGPAHWEILTRARALDNQIYLAIASPARSEVLNYKAYGHSLVVDPWGKIIQELDEKEGILVVDINKNKLKKVRNELPVLQHRKPKIY